MAGWGVWQEDLRRRCGGVHVTTDIEIAKAAITAGFSAANTPTAVAIALAESQGFAHSSSANRLGLWRLNTDDAPENWADPVENAKAARKVFERDGWQYWPTWRSGAFLVQMPRGAAAAAAATLASVPDKLDGLIPNPLEPIQQLAEEARRGLSVVSDRDTWIRVGMLALGTLIVVAGMGALLLSLSGKSLGSVTRTVIGSKAKAGKKIVKGNGE